MYPSNIRVTVDSASPLSHVSLPVAETIQYVTIHSATIRVIRKNKKEVKYPQMQTCMPADKPKQKKAK